MRLGSGLVVASLVLAGLVMVAGAPAGGAAPSLSISIAGNHFVDGAGRTVRLLGVNRSSSEYGCVDGFGYDDGHFTDADAAAIASWGADAVRVPLNEDCWLGINGQPNSTEGADPALTRQGYQLEVENYVADLNRHGLYAILDLHWTAPGSQVALEQQPMADFDHSPAFWSSVASSFRTDHAVVFDLFNEPYDPTDPRSGSDHNPNDTVSWNCWRTGTHNGADGGTPCYTSAVDENNGSTGAYRIAGMQTLLDAVRAAGATQPVLAGGLNFGNDLGQSDHGQDWLTHAPSDTQHQVAASFHNYQGQSCDTPACWTSSIAPVATHVPVVTGEFDEDNYDESTCATHTASSYDARFMAWADTVGISYLAWGWIVESAAELASDRCSAYVLITDYSSYAPAQPNGVALRSHLLSLRVPSPPRLPGVVAGKAAVAVHWSAPVGNGGPPVSGYRVLRSTDGRTYRLTATVKTAHYTQTRLSGGTRYWFTIQAVNSAGVSAASATVSSVPFSAPSAPRAFKVKVGVHSARLRWAAPSNAHGATISRYVVQYAACTFGAKHCTVHSVTVRTRSVTLHRLAHVRYDFCVSAVNRAGRGAASKAVHGKPRI